MATTINKGNLEAILTEAVKTSLGKKSRTEIIKSISDDAQNKFSRENQKFNTSVTQRKNDLSDHTDKRRTLLKEDHVPELPEAENGYMFSGRLIDETDGKPIPYARLRIMDLDREDDDPLGTVTTDSSGKFCLFYTHEDFEDADAVPEIYVEVLDEQDRVILRTRRSMVEKTPKNAWYEISVDAGKLPENVKKTRGALTGITDKQTRRLSRLTTVVTFKKPVLSSIVTASGTSRSVRLKANAAGATDRPQSGAAPSLIDIKGLGKVSVKKLEKTKIKTVKSFASASTDRIAKSLNISPKKAQAMKDDAKALLK